MEDHKTLKRALHKACLDNIEARIQTIEQRLADVVDSRNNETKSSVGDKYETGRAMMQMEEEKSKRQLHEATLVQQVLNKIDLDQNYDQAITGSLIFTNNGRYYLSVGIGKMQFEGQVFYCISINSPIGQQLKGRKVGDTVEFNGRRILIEEVC